MQQTDDDTWLAILKESYSVKQESKIICLLWFILVKAFQNISSHTQINTRV